MNPPLHAQAGSSRGRRTSWWAISAILGAVLLIVAVVARLQDRPTPRSFTAAPATTTAPVQAPGTRSSRATSRPALAPKLSSSVPLAPPAQLALPSLGVQATVQDVITTNGVLGVPDNIADVGWWTGSAPPGSPTGTTVIDGHVDSAVSGTGALFRLPNLQAGDPVTITNTTGHTQTYRVIARQVFVKHQGLPASLFTATGAPRLVLITCGGPFDTTTRNYEDNIVVLATPQNGA